MYVVVVIASSKKKKYDSPLIEISIGIIELNFSYRSTNINV